MMITETGRKIQVSKKKDLRSYQSGNLEKGVVVERLRQEGFRVTRQRKLLIEIILKEKCSCCKEVYILASKIQGLIYRNVNKHYAILMSDIENFHFINESYGYQFGNELLEILAKEFAIFDQTVLTNHFHTDVFISVVDVSDISDERFIEKVEERNTRITDMIKEKNPISYFRINTGICMIDQQDVVHGNLISFANLARRKAKAYTNHICIFTDVLNKEEQKEKY